MHHICIIVMYICTNTNTKSCHLWRGSVLVTIIRMIDVPLSSGGGCGRGCGWSADCCAGGCHSSAGSTYYCTEKTLAGKN